MTNSQVQFLIDFYTDYFPTKKTQFQILVKNIIEHKHNQEIYQVSSKTPSNLAFFFNTQQPLHNQVFTMSYKEMASLNLTYNIQTIEEHLTNEMLEMFLNQAGNSDTSITIWIQNVKDHTHLNSRTIHHFIKSINNYHAEKFRNINYVLETTDYTNLTQDDLPIVQQYQVPESIKNRPQNFNQIIVKDGIADKLYQQCCTQK